MARRLTHEQFIERLYERNKNAENIEILGQYTSSKTPIKCKCKIDRYEWETTPNILLSGCGCPMCGGKIKKTHEQFIKELAEINSDIEVLGKYITTHTKVLCRCKIDNYTWEIEPHSLLHGNGCPECASKRGHNNQRKTHEQFIKELEKINLNIEILSEYQSALVKIKCKCSIDNYIWEVKPNHLLAGNGCPVCANNKKRKTHEQFIKELAEINSDIEVLDKYINSFTKIKCRCKIDGCEWEVRPNSLLSGQSCPKCNNSKGEKAIAKYLEKYNIVNIPQYKFENCKFNRQLPFDFYIPSLNIAIEYDGKQHHKIVEHFGGLDNFIEVKIRDTIKTIYCKENNIRLIRIPYWEFDNIENILDKIF